jgi:hypothetical protein
MTMINSIKVRTPILALILFMLTAGQAFAADKVVVVPLMGSDVTRQEFNELKQQLNQQITWSGRVWADGQKAVEGQYTSQKIDTGEYRVSINVAHLDLLPAFPVPSANLSGDTGTVVITGLFQAVTRGS